MEITIKIVGLEGLANAIASLGAFRAAVDPAQLDALTPAPVKSEGTWVSGSGEAPKQEPERGPIATSAKAYTLDELSKAAVGLLDMGMQSELQQLLQGQGVKSMPELEKDQYADFALKLRELGANI